SSFSSISWNQGTLSFTITAGQGANGLEAMMPLTAPVGFLAGSLTSLKRNGSPITYTTKTIKGIDYVFFPATNGDYQALYSVTSISDTTPPTVSNVTPASGATSVTVTTTVTATFSEAMKAATINAGSFELRDAANMLVTATVSYDAGTY